MTGRERDQGSGDKPSAPCHLCGGTGKVIVRGSTDGNEWTYACHHNGTLAPINPWQTGGPGQGVPGVNVTVTYGDSKMKCPSNIGGDCLHQPKGCPSACVRPMVEADRCARSAGTRIPEVRLGEMHESNGTVTWIVSLSKTPDAEPWNCHQVYADTIKGRAEYEAARLKHFLGQGPEPDIMDFDTAAPVTRSARKESKDG